MQQQWSVETVLRTSPVNFRDFFQGIFTKWMKIQDLSGTGKWKRRISRLLGIFFSTRGSNELTHVRATYESVFISRDQVERSYDVDSDDTFNWSSRRQVRQHSWRQRFCWVVGQRIQPERSLATEQQQTRYKTVVRIGRRQAAARVSQICN